MTLCGMSSFRNGTDGASSRWPSLLVLPERARLGGEIRRIGCGIDGGEASACALRVAARAAIALDAELEVIRALTSPSDVIDHVLSEELAASALVQLRHAMAALSDEASAQGVIVQDRDPVRGIASRSCALDLLIVGTRSGAPAGSAVLGAFSARLVEQAQCPLLVVPLGVETSLTALFNA